MSAWRENHKRTLIACLLILLVLGRSVGAAFGEAPFSITDEEPGLVSALSLAVDVPTELGFTSDIALSGMMFVLFNLGAGRYALDQRFAPHRPAADWDAMGLLLRLSLAAPLIVGGFFAGYDHIPSFAMPAWLLATGGILLVFGSPRAVSATGAVMAAVLFWYLVQKTSLDKSLIANLNSYKRELALLAAAAALAFIGGGVRFTGQDILVRMKHYHRRTA